MGQRNKNTDFINKFLSENINLTHEKAAELLCSIGHQISRHAVREYRRRYKLPYNGPRNLVKKIKADVKSGIVFTSGSELVDKYGMSKSHANKIIKRILAGTAIDVSAINDVEKVKRVELPPVRVGTFEHMYTQLTASKFVHGM